MIKGSCHTYAASQSALIGPMAVSASKSDCMQRMSEAEPFCQLGPPTFRLLAFDRHGQRPFLSDQHDKTLATRDAGINQVPLEHHVVLRGDGNHHDRVFRPLGLMNRRRMPTLMVQQRQPRESEAQDMPRLV
jgi:hypothetical protein